MYRNSNILPEKWINSKFPSELVKKHQNFGKKSKEFQVLCRNKNKPKFLIK
jgi:hypothetical protein